MNDLLKPEEPHIEPEERMTRSLWNIWIAVAIIIVNVTAVIWIFLTMTEAQPIHWLNTPFPVAEESELVPGGFLILDIEKCATGAFEHVVRQKFYNIETEDVYPVTSTNVMSL